MNTSTPRSAIVPWTVLLVDDEPEVRDVLRRMLQRSFPQARFLEAANGREGLAALSRETIDLIICDQRMPEMDGLTFMKHVQSVSPSSGRVMLTGHADIELVQRAINEGHIHAFFQKPATGATFVRAMGLLLESHHAIHQLHSAYAHSAVLARQSGSGPHVGPLWGDG